MSLIRGAERAVKDALEWAAPIASTELFAWTVFISYFALILACFALVFASILDGVKLGRLFEGRAFYFVRAAVAALGCTWYFMIRFMQWSYQDHASQLAKLGRQSSVGLWLLDTPLFEQAWGEVCSSPAKWWWSSFICTWTVVLTAIIWREGALRRIKYPWAYMLLGMSVAISVATALFIAATLLHPRLPATSKRLRQVETYASHRLYLALFMALYTVHITPKTLDPAWPGVGFLKNVLWMHMLLVLPLVFSTDGKSLIAKGDDGGEGRAVGTEAASRADVGVLEGTSPESGMEAETAARQDEALAKPNDGQSSLGTAPSPTTAGSKPLAQPLYAEPGDIPYAYFNPLLSLPILAIHAYNTYLLFHTHAALPSTSPLSRFSIPQLLLYTYINHPAQASISSDVVCTLVIVLSWFLCTGSYTAIFVKGVGAFVLAAGAAIRVLGLNWRLIFSLAPIVLMTLVGLGMLSVSYVRGQNEKKRKEVLSRVRLRENTVQPGEKGVPPRKVGRRMIVGFWHPYCNAGGGGERVLWSAIAYTQRTQPDTVCLVYSGDYPSASKEAILGRARDRFSIDIKADKLIFIPLPSRFLISDNYWTKFTLLGQSLGSVYLAWEGLCGKDGLWGDVFIDTMGHGFTFPFVRLIAGSQIVTAAYVHYPTVSTDMVRRVTEELLGVESGHAASRGWRKGVKLVYYRIFTSLYATALLFCEDIMTNSTWTQNHIASLLEKGREGWLASLLLLDAVSEKKRLERAQAERTDGRASQLSHGGREAVKKGEERGKSSEEQKGERKERCEVLFPPCDTAGLVGFELDGRGRGRGIVSLAQFRPEKEHAKQLYALQALFNLYPMYRTEQHVKLTLMGGVRDEGDQRRLDGLKALAVELGVQDNVEFFANAPYPEVVRRLGQASLGLNTMQDEHFGINVVEFMAAGLIPIVHASAGPKLDIVVAQNGDQTGYHSTDATSFAESIHSAFSLTSSQDLTMRQAARDRAVRVFSQEAFEIGWERHWGVVKGMVRDRARDRGEVLEG